MPAIATHSSKPRVKGAKAGSVTLLWETHPDYQEKHLLCAWSKQAPACKRLAILLKNDRRGESTCSRGSHHHEFLETTCRLEIQKFLERNKRAAAATDHELSIWELPNSIKCSCVDKQH